jgi:tRNA(fMet)-specific endonuclease VapC
MTGNNPIILDSNIVIEVLTGNKEIADKINKLPGFYITSVVLGELYVGVNRVSNKVKHLKMLNTFLKLCTVLDTDSITARYYGELMAVLYKKGNPVPTNDVWIAAIAKQYGYTIVTMDKHFREMEDVNVKFW